MTRVLVLGGTGMLGHQVWRECSRRFDCWATVRTEALAEPAAAMLDPERTITGLAADDPAGVGTAIERTGAQVVVNCIGIVKQSDHAREAAASIRVNSLFPHEVAAECRARGARVIQVSTDCVFAGDRGGYGEDDLPDARDLYGRSKLLGELEGDGALTVRTSIVGRELEGSRGLIEWFLGRQGTAVRGFTRALFSGMTTRALAVELAAVIADHPTLEGVWHLGGPPIAKHDLLALVRDALGLDVQIEPDDSVVVDRSLDSTRYRIATGRMPSSWPEMIEDLARDRTPYESLRGERLARR